MYWVFHEEQLQEALEEYSVRVVAQNHSENPDVDQQLVVDVVEKFLKSPECVNRRMGIKS